MRRRSIALALVVMGACSSGQTSGNSPFTGVTLGDSAATQPPDVDDADDEEGSSGGKGPDDGATSGDPFGEETAALTTSGMPPDTTGMDETTAAGEESSTGMFMPGNGQPASGMYASCYDPDLANCTAFADVCLMIEALKSGICTHDACTTPADCHPAPLDATAPPICIQGQSPEGQDVGLCGLDCASGQTCPAGMQCAENVSFGEEYPIYSFCI
jgi:hypothetical protein